MTDDEQAMLRTGYYGIYTGITRILDIINLYKQYKTIIYSILDARFPVSEQEFPYGGLLSLEPSLNTLKSYFQSVPEFEGKLSIQFKTFLQVELSLFNPDGMALLYPHIFNEIGSFLQKQKTDNLSIVPTDSTTIQHLYRIPRQYIQFYHDIMGIYSKLEIFLKIRDIDGHIVMIGANGSGKSTFARQLNSRISSNVAILSAQHFLFCHKTNSIPAKGKEIDQVQAFQQQTKLGSDENIQQLLVNDMDHLLSALLSQHADCAFSHYSEGVYHESILKKVTELWNQIIEHRTLVIDRTGIYVTGDGIQQYEINQLSDGEKAVFYYIGHVLLAKNNSYIIVDEPENHLHLTICNKLWDELEKSRQDCKFIYLTHNLDFASSRTNCTILWNKRFIPPLNWDVEIIPKDLGIPEPLVLEILGSRNGILFCEGNDKKLE